MLKKPLVATCVARDKTMRFTVVFPALRVQVSAPSFWPHTFCTFSAHAICFLFGLPGPIPELSHHFLTDPPRSSL